MLEFPLWKRIWFWLLALLAVAAAIPSIVSISGYDWPESLPNPQVNLGLDLAGGSHILLEADPGEVRIQRLEAMEEAVLGEFRRAEPRIEFGNISTSNGRLSFMLDDPSQVDAAREEILPLLNGPNLTRDWDLEVVDSSRFIITPTNSGLETAVNSAMEAAIEVVRKRIDELGTREPTIIREGDTRIVVQVPGFDDPEALKSLLGQTAELEFKLVTSLSPLADEATISRGLGEEVVPYAAGTDYEGFFEVVERLGGIRGDSLTDAQASRDPQTNEPVVNLTFDNEGGRRFARLTQQNVNERFAIILDGEVISAPGINEPILAGSAQISGSFTPDETNQLAIALRSGALPVELTVIQQGTVGPELGQDSIEKGMLALGIGAIAVLVLMFVTYGRFGMYANFALVINVLMLLGIMSILNVTLTLPGIAGFVLTIGAAVDANVLINERIGEERKRGRRVIAAVENGYKEASRAIWDANLTNVIATIVLASIAGAGPVRGFAIVLLIGIATSIFTAVYLTRMWVSGWLRKARPKDLNV